MTRKEAAILAASILVVLRDSCVLRHEEEAEQTVEDLLYVAEMESQIIDETIKTTEAEMQRLLTEQENWTGEGSKPNA